MKVFINKNNIESVFNNDGNLIGYIEHRKGGFFREVPISNKYKIILV